MQCCIGMIRRIGMQHTSHSLGESYAIFPAGLAHNLHEWAALRTGTAELQLLFADCCAAQQLPQQAEGAAS